MYNILKNHNFFSSLIIFILLFSCLSISAQDKSTPIVIPSEVLPFILINDFNENLRNGLISRGHINRNIFVEEDDQNNLTICNDCKDVASIDDMPAKCSDIDFWELYSYAPYGDFIFLDTNHLNNISFSENGVNYLSHYGTSPTDSIDIKFFGAYQTYLSNYNSLSLLSSKRTLQQVLEVGEYNVFSGTFSFQSKAFEFPILEGGIGPSLVHREPTNLAEPIGFVQQLCMYKPIFLPNPALSENKLLASIIMVGQVFSDKTLIIFDLRTLDRPSPSYFWSYNSHTRSYYHLGNAFLTVDLLKDPTASIRLEYPFLIFHGNLAVFRYSFGLPNSADEYHTKLSLENCIYKKNNDT